MANITTKKVIQLGLIPATEKRKKKVKIPFTATFIKYNDRGGIIKGKPLSVNEAWMGQRFKTDAYKVYERVLLGALTNEIKIPVAPYELYLRFGFSSPLADLDNPVKCFVDILQKKYKFNDKDIFRLVIEKEIVNTGSEFIKFEIIQYR